MDRPACALASAGTGEVAHMPASLQPAGPLVAAGQGSAIADGRGGVERLEVMLKDSIASWFDHRAGSKSAALAFYTLFSLPPILLLAIAFAGYVFGADAAQGGDRRASPGPGRPERRAGHPGPAGRRARSGLRTAGDADRPAPLGVLLGENLLSRRRIHPAVRALVRQLASCASVLIAVRPALPGGGR